MKNRHFIAALAFVALAAALLITGCSSSDANSDGPLRRVEVVMPTSPETATSHSYSGRVKMDNLIGLGFKVGGEIVSINVKEGDKVKKGQLLAQLDKSDYCISRDAAKILYEQVKDEVGRIEQLYQRKSVSENDYVKAVAGMKRAEAGYLGYQKQVDYTSLYAPADGEVTAIMGRVNELTDAGVPVMNILERKAMHVRVSIPMQEVQRQNSMLRVECVVDGKGVAMQVLSVSPVSDNNQLYEMLLSLRDNVPSVLAPGMNVSVKIYYTSDVLSDDVFSIPMRSVVEEKGQRYVWVVGQDSVVHRRTVITEGLSGENVLVRGLTGNERIVKAGVHHVIENEKVVVL